LFRIVSEVRPATQRHRLETPAEGFINDLTPRFNARFQPRVSPKINPIRKLPMTSIAATTTGYLSPLDRLQNELQSEVSSGAISSADQTVLSTALDSIDQSLQADRSNDGQASGPHRLARSSRRSTT
jgi:hypothetical protein